MKIIIGNKSDLNENRVISFQQGQDLANKYSVPFIETSAKSDYCINDLFEKAALNFIEKLENTNVVATEDKKIITINKETHEDIDRITNMKSRKKNSLLINVDNKSDSNCCR